MNNELESKIAASLDNALTYGYDELLDWSDEQIAYDLIDLGSQFEFCKQAELIPYIKTWRAGLPPR